jgi:hypothetical protein
MKTVSFRQRAAQLRTPKKEAELAVQYNRKGLIGKNGIIEQCLVRHECHEVGQRGALHAVALAPAI